MEIQIWHYWIMASIILITAEIFIPSFIIINLGVGSLFGAIAALFGVSIELQIIIAALFSLISFFTVRPILVRWGYRKSETKTNVDAMQGKIALVSTEINNAQNKGYADLEGTSWRSKSIDDEIIPTGSSVEVLRVDSTILYVKKK